ncbi:biotin--[acetyl-CoA-carboxylase] ligase [Jannaschia sp. W003]|uniref:biotin--[acetyl-CoA-carboxylase] ligase n=1 Tax=Jannaschia sp. W003 TaxID=2867012 RepID=UPI0021A59212|nr:biotin--[acetyl-CoA-carboxylase] ligase [Jannaschia sp. W003]UWQ22848.1 biotin--[acetyl-CoA-carboxylase] ligase [Jannaschia sp. W003]
MSWPEGVGRIVLGTVGSTSEEARLRAASAPLWVLAHAQTAARGRRGRPWAMPLGNFAASLAWRPPGTPADHALRSFAASLALLDALEAFGVEGLALKWPNDVLLGGAKLAGILLEAPDPELVVLGVGVNLAAAPDTSALEPGALPPASLDGRVAPEALLDALAPRFAAEEARLIAEGFAPLRRDWLARAHGLGAPATARLPAETVPGTFEDVDAAGHFVMRTPGGRRAIPAGDVFFGGRPCS